MKNVKLSKFWDSLRSSYWFLPSLMVGGAIALAVAMLTVDRAYETDLKQMGWLYSGGTDGARSMLSAIAGSMVSVAGTAFSITIVALQLASSSFGPRLLKNFMQDLGNQLVLGTFIGTFIYCLLVLRTIRGEDYDFFIPQVSITVGVVLAIVGVGVLIYFIHHASTIIQVSQVIANVGSDLDHAIDRLFPEKIGQPSPRQVSEIPQQFGAKSTPIYSTEKGYLQVIDDEQLMKTARQFDLLLRLETRPGQYLIQGSALASVYPSDRVDQALTEQINKAFVFGKERSEQQDVLFPVEQLVEIALRALSPGINDPFTAIRCVDRLSAGLCHLAQRNIPPSCRYDDDHNLRVLAEPVKFEEMVHCAFNSIRQYGKSDSMVTLRLLDAIALIATYAEQPKHQAALRHHAEMIRRSSREAMSEECDRAEVESHYQHALAALARAEPDRKLRQL
ncbi:DUF2254 domain-containing protein [Myxacorys almedinensis]|uniref:DUF2254 domain-containing protein n=1 Tax=Myxacorys almedinensis A TaxID=2690445 RepID=A0A8J8CGN1_9CYAN|nr:DUF2254 domain-containing protein [Myxacorys almedinensis]NDJ15918.1 DUF2254 domain-containing protein [Myxacorys almedinensis A]